MKKKHTPKATPRWDPFPYETIAKNNSMITATRPGHVITRNSSFFKRFYSEDESSQKAMVAETVSDRVPVSVDEEIQPLTPNAEVTSSSLTS